jgi:hypothetical protein
VPFEVPKGISPVTLPSDIDQTINNHFCFLIQYNGVDNYSLNMKALNNYDLSNITKDAANTALMNVSESLNENTWYTVSESIIGTQVTAQIKNSNGTVIENMSVSSDSKNTILLVANNVDNSVIIRNLDIQSTNKPAETKASSNNNELILPSAILAVALIAGSLLVMNYFRKKVKTNNL